MDWTLSWIVIIPGEQYFFSECKKKAFSHVHPSIWTKETGYLLDILVRIRLENASFPLHEHWTWPVPMR